VKIHVRDITVDMDKTYKLTPLEYAQLKGLSTSGIRKRRLAGKEEGNFKFENGKYFYKSPSGDRPNIVPVTAHNNPKFHGSQFRPKKYASQYKTRRRNIPRSDLNYANAANGGQLQELNDIRQLTAIDKRLEEKHLKYLVPKIIELAKKEYREDEIKAARKKADAHLIQKPNYDAQQDLRNIIRADRQSRSSQSGRWYNHTTEQMEDYSPKKRVFKYYG
tara:strand:+ start:1903 stop:2559 length:657 start_codon:yes stop_codon:yes gene_type:complete